MAEVANPVSAGSLLDYARIARRRGWVIVVTAAVAAGGAYYVANRAVPVYQSQTEVLVRGTTPTGLTGSQSSGGSVLSLSTELRVLQGIAVRQAVTKALPNATRIKSAKASSDNSFTITAESTDPALAAASANAYAKAYIDQRRGNSIDEMLAVTQQIQTKITDLQRQIDALGPAPVAAPGAAPHPVTAADVQRTALQDQRASFATQLNTVQFEIANVSPGALVLSPATASSAPVAPRPKRSAAEAAVGGLVLGIAIVFLMEYLDDTVTTSDVLQGLTGSLPLLGVIPTVPGWRSQEGAKVTSLTAPSSQVAEAFRYLRTSVRFLSLDRAVKVIQVTSPASREGKTTTVANLAVVMAQVGERVLIVDFDLRRPRVHEFFGLSNDVGFTSFMLGEAKLSAAIQPVPGVAGLAVLAAGTPPPNPSEVLSSSRTADVMATLRTEGWTVIVDSPPVLPVTDASIVSSMVDVTLLVTSAGLTKKKEVKRAVELLHQVRAPLVGTVLNRAQSGPADYYGYNTPGTPDITVAGPVRAPRPTKVVLPPEPSPAPAVNGHGVRSRRARLPSKRVRGGKAAGTAQSEGSPTPGGWDD
ncbi:MAG: polysaccharide biosynthesis tyrosine autokinase [Actinomycetota bacterium]|nr:polysaccharide biosynthesis tyrosine autokinase [Actinomycetota bacterium]